MRMERKSSSGFFWCVFFRACVLLWKRAGSAISRHLGQASGVIATYYASAQQEGPRREHR